MARAKSLARTRQGTAIASRALRIFYEMKTAADLGRRFVHLRERDVVALERDRTAALARCGEVRVEHRRRRDAHGLADATPETARWHDDRFYLRHFRDAHHVVAVEVLLLDASVLDRAAAFEQRGQPPHGRARSLPLDLGWIDRVSGILAATMR